MGLGIGPIPSCVGTGSFPTAPENQTKPEQRTQLLTHFTPAVWESFKTFRNSRPSGLQDLQDFKQQSHGLRRSLSLEFMES